MAKPTISDVDALWGPATPQFAFQIADRIATLVGDLAPDDPVRVHADARLAGLHDLGLGTTKGDSTSH
ncbi:MAG TPA: hypothetical protein VMU66_07130 [Gaiellales bacterium]|nr:hypothetical protein [Gaiellales bacterium]